MGTPLLRAIWEAKKKQRGRVAGSDLSPSPRRKQRGGGVGTTLPPSLQEGGVPQEKVPPKKSSALRADFIL